MVHSSCREGSSSALTTPRNALTSSGSRSASLDGLAGGGVGAAEGVDEHRHEGLHLGVDVAEVVRRHRRAQLLVPARPVEEHVPSASGVRTTTRSRWARVAVALSTLRSRISVSCTGLGEAHLDPAQVVLLGVHDGAGGVVPVEEPGRVELLAVAGRTTRMP